MRAARAVIPTEAARLFLAHGSCAPRRAVEGSWQSRSITKIDGTQLTNHDRPPFFFHTRPHLCTAFPADFD
jgi:hypothetical protein